MATHLKTNKTLIVVNSMAFQNYSSVPKMLMPKGLHIYRADCNIMLKIISFKDDTFPPYLENYLLFNGKLSCFWKRRAQEAHYKIQSLSGTLYISVTYLWLYLLYLTWQYRIPFTYNSTNRI